MGVCSRCGVDCRGACSKGITAPPVWSNGGMTGADVAALKAEGAAEERARVVASVAVVDDGGWVLQVCGVTVGEYDDDEDAADAAADALIVALGIVERGAHLAGAGKTKEELSTIREAEAALRVQFARVVAERDELRRVVDEFRTVDIPAHVAEIDRLRGALDASTHAGERAFAAVNELRARLLTLEPELREELRAEKAAHAAHHASENK